MNAASGRSSRPATPQGRSFRHLATRGMRQRAAMRSLVRSYSLTAAAEGERYTSADRPARQLAGQDFAFSRLRIMAGQLALDDHVIHAPRFGPRTIHWSQTAGGIRSIGRLVFRADLMMVFGAVTIGEAGGPLHEFRLTGTMDAVQFATTYSPANGDDGSEDADTTSLSGPDFAYGVRARSTDAPFDQDPDDPTVFAEVYGCNWSADDPTAGGPADYVAQGYAVFSMENDELVMLLTAGQVVPPLCATPAWDFTAPIPFGGDYQPGKVVFSDDGAGFSGTVYDLDGRAWIWTGRMVGDASMAAGLTLAPPADLRDHLSAGQVSQDDERTVQELAAIQLDDVQTTSNGLMYDCMLYVMPADTRGNVFGRSRPTNLSKRITDTITEDGPTSFLNDHYTPTYAGWGFANTASLSDMFSTEQTTELEYALSNVMSSSPWYSSVNGIIYAQAAYDSSAALAAYMTSADDAAAWAQKLYEYITAKARLIQVKVEIIGASNTATYNNYNNLLFALDPDGDLAVKYHTQVYALSLMTAVEQATPDASVNSDVLALVMPDILRKVITAWINLPDDPTQGDIARQAMAAELSEAVDLADGMTDLCSALIQAFEASRIFNLASSSVALYNNLNNSTSVWGPRLAKFATGICALAGVSFAVIGYLNWTTLSDEEKVTLVATTVRWVAEMTEKAPNLLGAAGGGANAGARALVSGLEEYSTDPALARVTAQFFADAAGVDLEASEVLVNDTVAQIAKRESVAMAKLVGKVLVGIGLFAGAVIAGVNIYRFVQDLIDGNGSVETIFDGIQAFTTTAGLICEAVALAVESALAAALAVSFAILGVIAAIVYVFWQKDQPPPDTPVQTYIKNTILPFVQALLDNPATAVPPDWSPMDGPQPPSTAAAAG